MQNQQRVNVLIRDRPETSWLTWQQGNIVIPRGLNNLPKAHTYWPIYVCVCILCICQQIIYAKIKIEGKNQCSRERHIQTCRSNCKRLVPTVS